MDKSYKTLLQNKKLSDNLIKTIQELVKNKELEPTTGASFIKRLGSYHKATIKSVADKLQKIKDSNVKSMKQEKEQRTEGKKTTRKAKRTEIDDEKGIINQRRFKIPSENGKTTNECSSYLKPLLIKFLRNTKKDQKQYKFNFIFYVKYQKEEEGFDDEITVKETKKILLFLKMN